MNAENPRGRGPQAVSLADEEAVKEVLVNTVFGLWDIVNNLTRLRPSKRERYRVTIFGSARAQPGTFVHDEVKRVAAVLAELSCLWPSPSICATAIWAFPGARPT